MGREAGMRGGREVSGACLEEGGVEVSTGGMSRGAGRGEDWGCRGGGRAVKFGGRGGALVPVGS